MRGLILCKRHFNTPRPGAMKVGNEKCDLCKSEVRVTNLQAEIIVPALINHLQTLSDADLRDDLIDTLAAFGVQVRGSAI